ncbi:MAG: cupin domain-containing protein [Erysipelotrichaceae bacterium]|jgi:glucose-6-phosphate isomerase|nr:cupin domain-containing protein [Erysipelotrichaceae bacterium]
MEVLKPKFSLDTGKKILTGKQIQTAKKTYGEAKGFYKEIDSSLSQDTLMYEVFSYEEGDLKVSGNLFTGLTVLYPVLVKGECNMTRGHFHHNTNCAEIYGGLSGSGLLLLMDESHKTWAEEVFTGSIHYIDGRLAHRLINTGEEPLRVLCVWPTTAGHDYQRVEENPFGIRVFKSGGKVEYR